MLQVLSFLQDANTLLAVVDAHACSMLCPAARFSMTIPFAMGTNPTCMKTAATSTDTYVRSLELGNLLADPLRRSDVRRGRHLLADVKQRVL